MENDIEKSNNHSSLSYRDRMAIEEHERLSPRLVYEIIRRDGIEELKRPARSLMFSGIAAGIVISFSFLCKAIFMAYVPEATWAPMFTNFGYTVGFLLVILGRMQLFTENTITTVVPMFNPLKFGKVLSVWRLWGIVLLSNLVGTTLAAYFLSNSIAINPEFKIAMNEIAAHVASRDIVENLIRGIPAGILIASIVWMMPTAKQAGFWVILFFTYLISLGDFTHVVVGSAEMAYWIFEGHANLYDYWIRFLLPTCLGNILGGTGVFTILVYGQVSEEVNPR